MALMLKTLIARGVKISANPEVVSRTVSHENFEQMLVNIKDGNIQFEEWRHVDFEGKKIRIVQATEDRQNFIRKVTTEYEQVMSKG